MNADMWSRWDEVVRVVDRVLDSDPSDRPAVVERLCAGDPVLRGAVDRLLDASARAAEFLSQPAAADAAPLVSWVARQEAQGLAAGTRFGAYEVTGLLGRGGMATVYLAQDHKHHRRVAVKVLHAEVAAAVRREWFLREINTAAGLHHPHILALHDSGDVDGLLYYVMPHVEGESLRQRLSREGRIPLASARRIAQEVAGALDYAHRQGVVHRDIKPENILLQDGQAVVADFGIARAIATGAASAGTAGTIPAMGTPAYMSPEQASSLDTVIDGRTDIYALGCVLYEMLTGQPPFTGKSTQEILARHAREPVLSLPTAGGAIAPVVERAVVRALAKLPTDRFASAAEFGSALTRTEEFAGEGSRWRRARRWIFGAGVLSVTLAGLIALGAHRQVEVRLGHRSPLTVYPGLEIDAAISPDGRFLAYAAGSMPQFVIYVRPNAGGTPVRLAPALPYPQRFPTWSPDGRRILFRSPRGIEVISALGGDATVLIRDPSVLQPKRRKLWERSAALMPGAWSPDGRRFIYVRSDSLYIAGIDGGPSRLVAQGGEPHLPVWSPDGHWIAFVRGNRQSLEPGFYFGNVGKSAVWLVRSSGGEPIPVTDDRSSSTSPAWLPDGRALLFVSDRDGGRDIHLARLSETGRRASTSTRLTTGLNPWAISLSPDGRHLVYSLFSESSNVWTLPIPSRSPVSVSEAQPVTAGNQVIEGFDVSPDGRWLAFDTDRSGNPDIYRVPVEGGEAEQLTTDPGDDFGPLWSPDGREIAFHAVRLGLRHVFVMSARGEQRVQVTQGSEDERSPVWLHGGHGILFIRNFSRADKELRVVFRDADGRWGVPRTVLRGDILQVAVSPEGGQLAFSSNRGLNIGTSTGDSARILVPVNDAATQLRPSYLGWSADSREIYYLALDPADRATIWSVPWGGGIPRLLVRFDDPSKAWHRYGFRVSGGRFYLTLGDRQSDIWQMEVITRR
jgi:serine/threonine-protein kinase